MANDIGGNPWVIDTASATALLETGVWIERIKWNEPSTTGHQAILKDTSDRVIWTYRALAAGNGIAYEADLGGNYDGLKVTTLGSGTLYIYIK